MRLTAARRERAREILERENERAITDPVDSPWVERVQSVCDAIDVKGKTIIAMLGTGFLAKALATDLGVQLDTLALQSSSDREGAYSARSLCQHVLAAHAVRLDIDLGVTGREPLNNQPFFGKATVYDARDHAHDSSRDAMTRLVDVLEGLNQVEDPDEAKLALRAFLQVRQKTHPDYDIEPDAGRDLNLEQFIVHVENFVEEDSESGKRAQAVGAGLLDVLASEERVEVGRIHDPDRQFPGDIGVWRLAEASELARAFEVRDKPVKPTDLYHFVEKSFEEEVTKVGMLAVARRQESLNFAEVVEWAEEERGVMLVVYVGWVTFVREVVFWSAASTEIVLQLAFDRVLQRMKELEVSEEGVNLWGDVED